MLNIGLELPNKHRKHHNASRKGFHSCTNGENHDIVARELQSPQSVDVDGMSEQTPYLVRERVRAVLRQQQGQ